MIDFIAVKKVGLDSYTPEFEKIRGLYSRSWNRFPGNSAYAHMVDLRPCAGINAILYLECRRGWSDCIQLIGCGYMSGDEIVEELGRIVVDPLSMKVSRVDLTADVPSVPVEWMRQHTWIKHQTEKRTLAHIVDPDLRDTVREEGIESVYLGKLPNRYRYYDKIAHLKHLVSKGKATVAEQRYLADLESRNVPVTRIERQCNGAAVPSEVGTIAELLANAPDLDVFRQFDIRPGGRPLPDPLTMRPAQYYYGVALRDHIEKEGLNKVVRYLNKNGGRNARVILATYADFLPEGQAEFGADELRSAYRRSTIDQFAAKGRWRRDHSLTDEKVRMEYEVTSPEITFPFQTNRLDQQIERHPCRLGLAC